MQGNLNVNKVNIAQGWTTKFQRNRRKRDKRKKEIEANRKQGKPYRSRMILNASFVA